MSHGTRVEKRYMSNRNHKKTFAQVYGAEWSYGVYGVACDPPRSETAHVYECSVFVGATVTRMIKCGCETSLCVFLFDL